MFGTPTYNKKHNIFARTGRQILGDSPKLLSITHNKKEKKMKPTWQPPGGPIATKENGDMRPTARSTLSPLVAPPIRGLYVKPTVGSNVSVSRSPSLDTCVQMRALTFAFTQKLTAGIKWP